MATLDIFNNDAFRLSALTQVIIDIPEVPTLIGDMGLFKESGMTGVVAMIERKGAELKLVPTSPRGGVPEPVHTKGRKLIPVAAVHMSESWNVQADEILGIRAFGTEDETVPITALVRERMGVAKAQMDLTHEYHRVGAIKGQVMDANGTDVLYDMYDIFGMTKQTLNTDITNAASTTDPKATSLKIKRMIQAKLGGRTMTGVQALVAEDYFDKLVGHDKMKKAWELWNNGQYLRQQQNEDDFEFAGVRYRVYSGGTSAGDFIPSGKGYAYPLGVPGMFQTHYAPAPFTDTVGSMGLPYYARQKENDWKTAIEGLAVSCPMYLNILPEAVIELDMAAP